MTNCDNCGNEITAYHPKPYDISGIKTDNVKEELHFCNFLLYG